jgi:hypothetical protein
MKNIKVSMLVLLIILVGFTTSLRAQFGPLKEDDPDQAESEENLQSTMYGILAAGALYLIIPYFHTNQTLELETGAVFTGYSDVRIPGDSGTLFSLSDDLHAKTALANRIRATRRLGERHNISLLAAWLNVKSDGTFNRSVDFNGTNFSPADGKINGYYWFNSYRLTYRYDLVSSFKTDFGLGLTIKAREAGIRLESSTKKSSKANLGFVPLINFRLHQYILPKLSFLLEGDALAAPQGRAEDIYAGVSYQITEWAKLKAGYRMLEGGADVKETYNFALFHYATLGVELGN